MRYGVETHKNGNMATVHFDRPLPRLDYEYDRLRRGFLDNEPIPAADRELGEALIAIPGVERFHLGGSGRYRASVTKGGAFGWDEVVPPLVEAVRRHLAPDDELVEVTPDSGC